MGGGGHHHHGHHGGGPMFWGGGWGGPWYGGGSELVVVDAGPSADESFMKYLNTLPVKERAKALERYMASKKSAVSGLGATPYVQTRAIGGARRGDCCDTCTCPGCCPLPIRSSRFAGIGDLVPQDAVGKLMIAGALLVGAYVFLGIQKRKSRKR